VILQGGVEVVVLAHSQIIGTRREEVL
jgi:hypothetical protein